MTSVDVHAFGRPAPQGSKRHVGGGRFVEMSKGLPAYRQAIVDACTDTGVSGARLSGPLSIDVTYFMPRPKTHFTSRGDLKLSAPDWCITTPDIDKVQRALFDALGPNGAQVIVDDRLIVDVRARMLYAPGSPSTHFTITTLERNQPCPD